MNKKAQEYLDSYGFNYIDATKVIDDYNFEDRKLVEIVKATYFNPKVLVVDETTTALGQKVVKNFSKLCTEYVIQEIA